ncbi:AraC family transcriptional regulator [Dysgonomonas sp. OttesenSCG-928-D17]|nr:AraC family transcriptional regulator [Dysgonomonas sp. OttesenSCG-928-D17]
MDTIIADGFKGEKAIITPYNIRSYQANNEVTRQIHVTHIGYYPNAKFHYRERANGTDQYIFIYCEKGKGWVEYDDERYILKENQFFILPPGEYHKYGSELHNPWSIYWLHFKGENIQMFDSIIKKHIDVGDADNARHQDRFRLFEEIYQNLEMGYNPENLEYITFCLMYFLASLKYLSQYREIQSIRKADVIQSSIVYMKENLENRITLHDIADAVSYSGSHLNTLFVQRTSYSPMAYYNQLKIQRACSYLQFSELKIKEIAFRLNFYDQFHFTKAFVKEMEITPKEYRKRYYDAASGD